MNPSRARGIPRAIQGIDDVHRVCDTIARRELPRPTPTTPAPGASQPSGGAYYAGITHPAYELVDVPVKSRGIHSIDVLNNLPALMAADGLVFDAEIIGAWICEQGGVRLVLRAVDRPRDTPFGLTITRADTTVDEGHNLAAGLWAGLARARELVTQGLNGDGTLSDDGIRWLNGEADDTP